VPVYVEPFKQDFPSPLTFDGGKVEVSPKRAGANDTVTLTVTPDEGQELKDLKVTIKGTGSEAKLNDNGNGVYTFTMPGGNVEINAEFGPAEAQQEENAAPEQGQTEITPAPQTRTENLSVQLSRQKFVLNGVELDVKAYNINGYNYVMLRDLAVLLSGTSARFNVKYDEELRRVIIEKGVDYDGALNTDPIDHSDTAQRSQQEIYCCGEALQGLNVFNIGGYNYFGLRELAEILGYSVDYDEARDTAIIKA